MRYILTIIFLLLLSSSLKAQTVRYYSRSFQTLEPKETPQKRLYYLENNGIWFEDYHDNKIEYKGFIKGTTSMDQADGYLWFLRSDLDMRYQPSFDALSGTMTGFRNNGKLDENFLFRGKGKRYIQVWDNQEKPVLVNGTGTLTEIVKEGKRILNLIYKDSVLTHFYHIRKAENDTIYYKTDKIASPKEGYNVFWPELAKAIGYPKLAQMAGKEGVAYITFFVEKNGKLSEIRPLSNEGFRMEAKALKQIAKLPSWDPATFQGRPVKTKYTIPIRYKLAD